MLGNWKEGTRHTRSVLIFVVAMLAIIATSRVPGEILTQDATGTVVMSPATSQLSIPWELGISVDDFRVVSHGVSFLFDVDWEDVDEGAEIEAIIIDNEGEAADTEVGSSDLLVVCVRDCIGRGVVVIRWPRDVTDGEAHLQWEGVASVTFDEDVPADEAAITFLVGDPG